MRSELKKIYNINFLICCLVTTLLCFSSEVYRDRINDRSYSVIDVLHMFSSEKISSNSELNFLYIFDNGAGSYVCLFLPIISSFPFVSSFCAERNSGLMRFIVHRTGRRKYYLHKFAVCVFSGGAISCFGYVIFGLVVSFLFPLNEASLLDIIPPLAGFVLYGAFSAIPAFFLSSFIYNRYIITCIPFLFVYALNVLLTKTSDFLSEEHGVELHHVAGFLFPDSIRYLFYFLDGWCFTLIFNAAITLIAFMGFTFIMNRRWDSGA